jgi:hypothetical protein
MPFRGKCPLCGWCSSWSRDGAQAKRWVEGHLDRRHHVPLAEVMAHRPPLVMVREYKPTRTG